jgi:hypothetical protein
MANFWCEDVSFFWPAIFQKPKQRNADHPGLLERMWVCSTFEWIIGLVLLRKMRWFWFWHKAVGVINLIQVWSRHVERKTQILFSHFTFACCHGFDTESQSSGSLSICPGAHSGQPGDCFGSISDEFRMQGLLSYIACDIGFCCHTSSAHFPIHLDFFKMLLGSQLILNYLKL